MTEKIDIHEALVTAASKGSNAQVKKLLAKGANINDPIGKYGETALMLAAHNGHADTVELLIDEGADIEAKAKWGRTALIREADWGDTEDVKLLINKGADIEARDDEGKTALMAAAMSDKTETVKLLLKKGADIEAKDEEGQTALMAAAMEDQTETVKLLLKRGADIEARDEEGQTALIVAAKKYNSDAVKLLLRKGADIEAKDDDGKTALDLVMLDEILDDEPYSRRTEIIAFLKSKTAAKKRKAVSEKYGVINELKEASARDMSGWKTFPIEELFQAKKADVKDEIVIGKPIQPNAKGPIPVPVYAEPKAKRKPDEPEKNESGGKSGTDAHEKGRQ